MIHSMNFNKIAKKWLDIGVAGRAKNSVRRTNNQKESSMGASKGCFVVYSSDWKRFAIPLSYLKVDIFLELLRMSEEEFGLSSAGPIRIPCDSLLIQHIVLTIQKGSDKTLLNSAARSGISSHSDHLRPQLLVCGY